MEQLDTGTTELLASRESGVSILTLNRPEAGNALSTDLKAGFSRMLQYLESDPETRVLVITANGQVFCAGADVKSMDEGEAPEGSRADASLEERIRNVQKVQDALIPPLYEFCKPTIAALPGAAAGAGLSLALAADLRIGTRSTFLTTAFAKIALSGDAGISWLLNNLIGPSKAKELLYTSRRITSDEALALGLLNHVCEDAELESFTMSMAKEIALAAPTALRFMKENVNMAISSDIRTNLNQEADRVMRCIQTNDHKEGVRAFVERRQPQFKGN